VTLHDPDEAQAVADTLAPVATSTHLDVVRDCADEHLIAVRARLADLRDLRERCNDEIRDLVEQEDLLRRMLGVRRVTRPRGDQ